MILSIDSNDANSAPLHKKTISNLSGAVESMMKKLEDVGVLVSAYFNADSVYYRRLGKNYWLRGYPAIYGSNGRPPALCCRW